MYKGILGASIRISVFRNETAAVRQDGVSLEFKRGRGVIEIIMPFVWAKQNVSHGKHASMYTSISCEMFNYGCSS